jgi:hypothetical protein
MNRLLYQGLLWLHPPAFRRQFAPEMLGIFEDAVPVEGVALLLFDAAISLIRQWLLRSGLWKIVAAVLGAALQLLPSLWWGSRPHSMAAPHVAGAPIPTDGFVVITCLVTAFLIFMVAASVFWAAHVSRIRRSATKR